MRCIIVAPSVATTIDRRFQEQQMARRSTLVLAGAMALAVIGVPLVAQQGTGPVPDAPKAPIPDGFTEIFNGKDTAGWHVSRTNHHGTMPLFRVLDGVLVGTQDPPGKGGILLTDKRYRNVEVFLEIKPDWGCDGGLFLRSSEAGEAYQVMLDYLPGGNMGGVYGERLQGVTAVPAKGWQQAWKREEWNTVRARIEGDVPRIQVWINGEQVTDFTDTANHAKDGATEGMIAIQMHYSNDTTKRWVPGGFWRWRTIAVKELP
jgi:hypothetical protein